MKKFEYRLLEVRERLFSLINYQSFTERLNELGQEGWELVAMTAIMENGRKHLLATLKRELPT